jgi:hypothetical protein
LLDDDPPSRTECRVDDLEGIGDIDAEARQHLACDGVALAKQCEEEVLRPDVAVTGTLGLLLGQRQYPFRRLLEALEWVHVCEATSGVGRRLSSQYGFEAATSPCPRP